MPDRTDKPMEMPSSPDSDGNENQNHDEPNVFEDVAIKHIFVRKMILILIVHLLLVLATFNLFPLAVTECACSKMVIFVGCIYWVMMTSWEKVRRETPFKQTSFVVVTFMIGFLFRLHLDDKKDVVHFGLAMCASIYLGIVIFTIQMKFEFSVLYILPFITLIAISAGAIKYVTDSSEPIPFVIMGICAFSFVCYQLWDSLHILAANRRYRPKSKEPLFAVLSLYSDIIAPLVYFIICFVTVGGNNDYYDDDDDL